LGGRDQLCVVGDDYQTIYSFTGATPSYLLEFRERFPHARVVTLEQNYRSSPQVLATANRLAERLGGVRQSLRATRAAGPPEAEPDSAEEATRQADLGRLRALAVEFAVAHPEGDLPGFGADLARRFAGEAQGRGVNLLTYHRAKGLEFDAVFLPRLLEKELPFRSGRAQADENEERRLLYVGITRARRHLYATWPLDPRVGRSRFVAELGD